MKNRIPDLRLMRVWRDEFRGYDLGKLRNDLLAGITVAAVALPLALAFGVASGATAAAGLVTAILAGLLIGGLGGAPHQISGPTGAMSAVLIVLASRYGLEGVWVACLIGGVLLVLMGLFHLGQIVNFIPAAVITGFTSGISVIIFVGQIDNLLGVQTPAAENTLLKLIQYARLDYVPNPAALGLGLLVILIMVLWPKHWNARFPGSLLGLVVATVTSMVLELDVPVIGNIPQTLWLDDRLAVARIPWDHLGELIAPALSIAALGAIESLLCGAVIGRQTGAKLDASQELIAQGVGNIFIPFFGGVPATAAIARSSVAVRSGGATRLTSVTHAAVLLLAALLFAPTLSRVPLAALGGVLAVTAWRTNDWAEIRDIFRHGFKSAISTFAITLVATVLLDLTQAIILGVGLSALIFVFQSSQTEVTYAPVSVDKMRKAGYEMRHQGDRILVVYIVGPVFFGTVSTLNGALAKLDGYEDVVISLRAVPLVDTSGISALADVIDRLEGRGRRVYLSGLTRPVRSYLERAGVIQRLGADRVYWSADQAIVAIDHYRAALAGQAQMG
ncbi:SulP family inorganic anion transporter [Limnochorda pilosa]|uniref:Sulfate permease n=1 Tax=Limnochorda pilosa TaxID=1555112 RepID=A0A0K2SGP9_LIMPI|nr:SulP family inorganic anion transporter [Limnochorda pilosa]BAS26265.1 sulfate permease [Limnochorda pilosa]